MSASSENDDPQPSDESDAPAKRSEAVTPNDGRREEGLAEGQRDGAIDGVPEGRAMALMVLVRNGLMNREQARARLLQYINDGAINEALGLSTSAAIARMR